MKISINIVWVAVCCLVYAGCKKETGSIEPGTNNSSTNKIYFISEIEQGNQLEKYTYDADNRIIRLNMYLNGILDEYVLYTYTTGKLTDAIAYHPDGTINGFGWRFIYSSGRIIQAMQFEDGDTIIFNREYNIQGQMTRQTEISHGAETTYTEYFYSGNNMTKSTAYRSSDSTFDSSVEYEYDSHVNYRRLMNLPYYDDGDYISQNNVSHNVVTEAPGPVSRTYIWNNTYDSDGKLTQTVVDGDITKYTYIAKED